jgi:hypothetical protein
LEVWLPQAEISGFHHFDGHLLLLFLDHCNLALMRFVITFLFVTVGVALTAWLAVSIAASLDSRAYNFPRAYLSSFLGIGALTFVFCLLAESLIEDIVKGGMIAICLLGILSQSKTIPTLIPCIAILGTVLAVVSNRILKKLNAPHD